MNIVEKTADFLALLVKEPRTIADLAERTEMSEQHVRDLMTALQDEGLVAPCDVKQWKSYRTVHSFGPGATVWEWLPTFEVKPQ